MDKTIIIAIFFFFLLPSKFSAKNLDELIDIFVISDYSDSEETSKKLVNFENLLQLDSDPFYHCSFHYFKATHSLTAGNYNLATNSYEKAISYIDKIEPTDTRQNKVICKLLYQYAHYKSIIGQLEEAKKFAYQAISYCYACKDDTTYSFAFEALASVLMQKGEYEAALIWIEKIFEIANKNQDDLVMGRCLKDMAYIEIIKKNGHKALALLKQYKKVIKQNYKMLTVYNRNMALAFMLVENLDSSFIYLDKSFSISEAKKDTNEIVQCLILRADLFKDLKNTSKAFNNAQKALQLIKNKNSRNGLKAKILVAELVEDVNLGITLLSNLKETLTEKNNKELLLVVYQALEFRYIQIGDYQSALREKNEVSNLNKSIFQATNISISESVAAQYELVQQDKRIKELEQKSKEIKERSIFMLSILAAIFVTLFLFFRNRIKRRQAKSREESLLIQNKYLSKISELESDSFRAQMNPHFMFNSLNAINNYVINKDRRLASRYLTKFSSLMRLVLNHSREKMITLKEELTTMKLYVKLEQVRTNDHFSFAISCPEKLLNIKIPPLVIQPFLENSIWHGLVPKKDGQAFLKLRIDSNETHLLINIFDNGVGRKASEKKKKKSSIKKRKSHGIDITKRRLELLAEELNHPANIEFIDLEKDGKLTGTMVKLMIPLSLEN